MDLQNQPFKIKRHQIVFTFFSKNFKFNIFFQNFQKIAPLLPKFDQLLPKFGQLLPILVYKVTFSKTKSDLIKITLSWNQSDVNTGGQNTPTKISGFLNF